MNIEKEYKSELLGFRTTPQLANKLKQYCQEKNKTISAFFSEIVENLEQNPEVLEQEIMELNNVLIKKKNKLLRVQDAINEEKERLRKEKEEAERKKKEETERKTKLKAEQEAKARLHKEFFRIIDLLKKERSENWQELAIRHCENNQKLLSLVQQWVDKELKNKKKECDKK